MAIPRQVNGERVDSQKLTKEEMERYSRQIILPEIGIDGQKKIKSSKVMVIGAGGLGCPALLYLAAAGVGTIGIVESDNLELSNLARQIIHTKSGIGHPKATSAKKAIKNLNPNVRVSTYHERLTKKNAMQILKNYDVIIDGTDNFPTRYLINDASFFLQKPLVYGSVFQFGGQISVLNLENGPCYRCIAPAAPKPGTVQNCQEAGVLGIVPGIIGTLQAQEALKIILGKETIAGFLLLYDAHETRLTQLKVVKNKNCALCGTRPTIHTLMETEFVCAREEEISVRELKEKMDNGDTFVLLDVREQEEWNAGRIPQAKHIPLAGLEKGVDILGKLSKNTPIVLHCRSGSRSMKALQILQKQGYKNIKSLSGGILAWTKMNLESKRC